jgi:uncharacterized sulfatase
MNRRAVMRLGLAMAIAGGWSAASADPPPNLVLIISDDHGWTDYGFMGHPHLRTPHLDRLASQSLFFPHGYVTASLCSPSLTSIITGLYPHQHRITSNDPPLPPRKTGAAAAAADPEFLAPRQRLIARIDRVPTLPGLLARRGYLSLQTGKWWLGHYRRGGFTHGMTQGDPGRGGRHGDEGLEIGRQTMQPIRNFLDLAQRQRKPFFLWYAPMLPHQPHDPPEPLLAHYRDRAPTLAVAKYWAMVEWFDETCGVLLAELERRDLARNTVVVYLADNGWIQEPAAARYAPRSKQSPYEGGLRTPILIRWPARVSARRSASYVSSIDLAPTLLRAAGLRPSRPMLGIDLLAEGALRRRRTLFGECFTHNAVDLERPASSLRWRWAIEEGWKLILPAAQNEPEGQAELYHLTLDPYEETNRALAEPRRVTRLTRRLNAWWDAR